MAQVSYAPRLSLNFFFYDGMYWLYQNECWYAANWYGPWWLVDPFYVPLFILRVPRCRAISGRIPGSVIRTTRASLTPDA